MSSEPDSAPPDAAGLYQAALSYLARYAATEAGLRRILTRRIELWARAQPDPEAAEPALLTARAAIDGVIAQLAASGVLSDTQFAEHRARSLVRSGRSNRAVQMRLVAKGVQPEIARKVAETDAETQLAAALVLARKRRIGPYRNTEDNSVPAQMKEARMKEMALLARAGFSRDIAQLAVDTQRDDAEARIQALRR